jgi:glucose-6-phosphate 1-dehydrogenase
MSNEIHPEPCNIVIFGAAGDLTWRKLIPALYDLYCDHWLPEQFAVIGLDAKQISVNDLCAHLRDGVDQFSRHGKSNDDTWAEFKKYITFQSGDFTDSQIYNQLGNLMAQNDTRWTAKANRIFYLATPPRMMEPIAEQLGKAHMNHERKQSRLVVEKPFGRDLGSARELNKALNRVFEESQIYRIDHYLGKETVQNIAAFRFANALFEPIWDRRYIDHVQITVAEQVGVEHRGEYYDHAGALRDMMQNHLMQILCMIAQEPPVSFDADEIRNKKLDVLRAIRPIDVHHVHRFAVRGQYAAGWVEGQQVPAYRSEPGVDADSNIETFAALKLFIDNWRWQDVPFYLRTGKRLPERISEVIIQFRPVPHMAFPISDTEDWRPNRLIIDIQPEEGILLHFQAKQPGPSMHLNTMEMHFKYNEAFKTRPPEAYETLLLDVMLGDATLFMRDDQVETAWSIITPILEAWEDEHPIDFPNYRSGAWGPEAAEILIAQDGRSWYINETYNKV